MAIYVISCGTAMCDRRKLMENEKFELILDEAQANAALEKGMLYADAFVNKNYLINLDRYPLVELDPAEKSDEHIRLYQIERIVYDVDENANDKLISVYSAFFNIQAAGLLIIRSTRNELGFYIGVRSVDNASTAEAILEKSFKGNFAGSQIHAIPQEEVRKVLGSINESGRFGTRQNVSSVSIVPSTRDEDKERFVQGIEKFIDTMKVLSNVSEDCKRYIPVSLPSLLLSSPMVKTTARQFLKV